MKINTKVVFEWNPKSKQYEEIYCDSYEYDGEVAECQLMWPQRGHGSGQRRQSPSSPFQMMYEDIDSPQNQLTHMDYMAKLRGFGSEGQIFGPTLEQPTRPNVGSSYRTYGGPGGPTASMLGDVDISNIPMGGQETLAFGGQADPGSGLPDPSGIWGGGGAGTGGGDGADAVKPSWMESPWAAGAGALLGGLAGYGQAKSQQKGLGAAIGELDPLKEKFMGAHERQLGLAEAYRPGGKYSRYMGGQLMSQAAESAGSESQRMIASGITSPSMMRQISRQSRRGAQAALPGMEMQLSQMALPYEQLGAESLTQYGGVVEQLASLRGAKASVNPWASAISGGMQGVMGAATMASSFMSDRRMKKDIKYLHKSNEGHKVYSFKYKDGDTKYSGVMAQDVLKINPNAVTLKNGMLAVYYDMIDVDMQRLDTI